MVFVYSFLLETLNALKMKRGKTTKYVCGCTMASTSTDSGKQQQSATPAPKPTASVVTKLIYFIFV